MGLLLYMLEAGGGGVVPLGGVGGGLALLVLRLGKGGGGGASPFCKEGGTLGGSIWWDRGGSAGGAPLATLGESERRFKVAGLARWILLCTIALGVPFWVRCRVRKAISGVCPYCAKNRSRSFCKRTNNDFSFGMFRVNIKDKLLYSKSKLNQILKGFPTEMPNESYQQLHNVVIIQFCGHFKPF